MAEAARLIRGIVQGVRPLPAITWHYLPLTATPEGENHEDASCCRHSCDGDRFPCSCEGEAGEIGAPARLSVVGATRLLPRLPSAGLVPRRVIELLMSTAGKRCLRASARPAKPASCGISCSAVQPTRARTTTKKNSSGSSEWQGS